MNSPVKERSTVRAHQQRPALPEISEPLDADWLRQLCLAAGADDGAVSVRLHHGGPQGAKRKAEVIADILAGIKERRA
jgi:hypothetical protein